MEAQASLTATQVSQVKVGDTATVLAAGSNTPIQASVVGLDLTGAESASTGAGASASTSVTFPITVALQGDAASQGLRSGTSASVSVVTQQASNVTSVPTSAIHTIGTRHFVYEVKNGKEVLVVVGVGAMGNILTQITSGLSVGDRVVLADLQTPIPTAGSTSSRGATFALSGGATPGAFVRGGGTGAVTRAGGAG
jgi:hypothetical protein